MRYLRLLPPLLSGLALSASFPDISAFFLAWVGLIPFLHFILEEEHRQMLAAGHLLFSFSYFGAILYWIPRVLVVYGGLSPAVAGLLFMLMISILSLFLAPFTFLLSWTAVRIGKGMALMCAPAFWIMTELVRNYWAVGGFPWAALGYSQIPYTVILQFADIGGVYLLSALIVAVNGALLALVRLKRIRMGAAVLALFTLVNLYGAYRLSWWSFPAGGVLRTGLLQGCVELAGSREYYAGKYFQDLARLFDRAVENRAALIILPESQNPFFYSEDFYFRTFWGDRARTAGAWILLNSAAFDKNDRSIYYNSAYLIAPSGESTYRYDKNHLVPFGEYLPMRSLLGKFARPLVREVSGFTAGREMVTGSIGEIRFGTLICYEGIFPELSREWVAQGALFLINITNDAWFGETAAAMQHLHMTALRAVENRRALVRAANTGYTALVTPLGRIRNRTNLFTEEVVVVDVPYSDYRTFYSYAGDWTAVVYIIVTFVIAARGGIGRWKEKEKRLD